MANQASEVVVGKPKATGGFCYAENTTATLPTDAKTALAAETFKIAGYVSEDGVTQTIDSTTEDIKAWGGDKVKKIETEHGVSFGLALLQFANAENLRVVFGEANVTEANGLITLAIRSGLPPRRSFVFEMADKPYTIRVVVPDGQISFTGELAFKDGEAITLPINIEAYPDSTGGKAYMYIDNPVVTAG